MSALQKLLDFLNRLDDAHITYTLSHFRSETIAVETAAPGERWAIDFFADGTVEVEVFKSAGPRAGLEGEEALERLFDAYPS